MGSTNKVQTHYTSKGVHPFFISLLLMFCLSAVPLSAKTAYAYLDKTFRQLFFDYADDSTIKSYQNNSRYAVWKGDEIVKSQGNPGWLSYSNLIGAVIFTNNFKDVKPYYLDHWFDGLNQVTYFQGISNLNTSEADRMNYMFRNCSALTSLDLSKFNTSKVYNFEYMFCGCKSLTTLNVSSFNTSTSISMAGMFMQCEKLTSLNLYNFNTQNVLSMNEMFRECKGLTSLNVSSFRTSKVEGMRYMFDECESLSSVNLSSFDTSNVKYMDCMFYGCTKLKSLDLSNFNTSKVQSMKGMFTNCIYLAELNIDGFNTSNVTDMNRMFQSCTTLRSLDVSSFNTSNVTDMSYMFHVCYNLKVLDVSNFDVSKVQNMDYMFYSCTNLRTILCSKSWSTGSSLYMFGESPNLVGAVKFKNPNTSVAYANPTTGYFTPLKTYNLWLCGEQVSNGNDFDLSLIRGVDVIDDGYATYDAASNTLKLKNVSISSDGECAIKSRIDGLTIQVDDNGNENEFLSAVLFTTVNNTTSAPTLYLQNNTTITGSGGMTVMSMQSTLDSKACEAIRTEKSLVFDNAKVAASGRNAIHGMFKGSMTVRGTKSYLKFVSTEGDVVGMSGITFEDQNRILSPSKGGIFKNDSYNYYIADVYTSMAPVLKSPTENPLTIGVGYGIYVNNVQVTSMNCDKLQEIYGVVVGEGGEFRYSPDTNTLYMKNVMVTANEDTIPLVLSMPDLTVEVKEGAFFGANMLISSKAKYALQISHRTTIKGNKDLLLQEDGMLYAAGGTESAVGIDNQARLTLDTATLLALGYSKGITGYGANTALNLNGFSTVRVASKDFSISGLSRINFNQTTIVSPKGAVYAYNPAHTLQCVSLNGEPVKDNVEVMIAYNPYDVNVDGSVDISDIVAVINTIAGDGTYLARADVNLDQKADISDIVAIINYIAGQ